MIQMELEFSPPISSASGLGIALRWLFDAISVASSQQLLPGYTETKPGRKGSFLPSPNPRSTPILGREPADFREAVFVSGRKASFTWHLLSTPLAWAGLDSLGGSGREYETRAVARGHGSTWHAGWTSGKGVCAPHCPPHTLSEVSRAHRAAAVTELPTALPLSLCLEN